MILRLVLGNLLQRKTRTILTSLAIAMSVALVVAMTSGIASIERAASTYIDKFMGPIDATIARRSDPSRGIDQSVLDALRADPQVKLGIPRLESEVPMPPTLAGGGGSNGNPLGPRVTLTGVDRQGDPLLNFMTVNKGRWFTEGERACVIDQGMNDRTGLQLGDTLRLAGEHGPLELPIVGIVHKPGIFSGFSASVYVPLVEAQTFLFGNDNPRRLSQIRLAVQPGTKLDAFADRWTKKLAEVDPLLRFRLSRQKRDEIDNNFMGLRILALLGGAVTMVSAMFIIFSTLSMGVAERQRSLAMLRAVGATKAQIARLVVFEGVTLSVIGAAVGTAIGYALAASITLMLESWFHLEPALDWFGVLSASGIALAAATVASFLPAWQAMRVDPLEAMTPLAQPSQSRFPAASALIGTALVAIDPILLFMPLDVEMARDIRFYSHFAIGLPAMMIGFLLLAPAFVWTLSRVLAPILAVILRVPYSLVTEQLGGGSLWRSAGTCAALMVGLATLIVMQVQGTSSLNSWKLPNRFPDVFIFTRSLSGLSDAQQEKLRSSSLLVREDVMPIATFSPEVGGGLAGLIGTRLPGNTMFVAVDPENAFRLMELDFRQGSPAEASRLLKQGDHVIITEELHRLKKLNLGDTLELKQGFFGARKFTVAGVVWSPGIDVMINAFDLSQQAEAQSAACVFGSLDDARKYFDVQSVFLMCANFREMGLNKNVLTTQLRTDLADDGIHVADVRQLKHMVTHGMSQLLRVASSVAWGALAVASVGVMNTIVASIRSRMWQFGVLRSIGLTRGTLMRIVLIEAILLGATGAAMGLACGFVMCVDARQIMTLVIGHHPPIIVPWTPIVWGVLSVIGVSLLASLLPALRVSRTEPLTLLQAGRSAA